MRTVSVLLSPLQYVMKVWVRPNGYLNDFQVYTGPSSNGHVIKDLTCSITGVHHIVNYDSSFSSPQVFMDLLDDNVYARGTVKQNR